MQDEMRILVTGCNGQLGTKLRELQASLPAHTFFNTDIAELDITDKQAVENYVGSHHIDGIVNCAAYTAVDKAEADATVARNINAIAPGILAQSVERRSGWMLHVSTDYVFDGTACTPYREDCRPNPTGVYGRTKLEGEQLVMDGCRRSIIVRTAWLYSEYGSNFVKTMMRLGHEREELSVVYDQVGSPTYAGDLAQAIVSIIRSLDAGEAEYGVFHYTNEGAVSWYDFTKAIHRIARIKGCKVSAIRSEQYPTPAKRPAYSVLDKAKIKNTYSIDIPYWEDSLRECFVKIQM